MNEIVIKNLSKSFDDKVIFNDLSLSIPFGERVAFSAPSGYGKTTLIRMILGLEKADGGEVLSADNKYSVVFQEDRLLEDFSVKTNIKFIDGNLDNEKLGFVLDGLKLRDVAKKPVKRLSGGMKRRVAIARAVCAEFDVLVMDEPFKGLDAALKEEVISFLNDYIKDKTLILVTHDIDDAKKLGCKIVDLPSLNLG